MKNIKCLLLILFLFFCFDISGQKKCDIIVDTTKILLDENLQSFLYSLENEDFKTYTDKKKIPQFIKKQLNCLTNDSFSIANPSENYRCCCTSSDKLPKRKLLFFSISKNVLLVTYLTGGIGVSTKILMLRFKDDKIEDIWNGFSFDEFKSKNQVLKFLSNKSKYVNDFHLGYISI